MNNAYKILVILVVLGLIAVGAFVLTWPKIEVPNDIANDTPRDVPTSEKSNEPPPPIDMSEWKTYKHAQVGFQFQYPAEYLLMTSTADDPDNPGTYHFSRKDPVADSLNEDVYARITEEHNDIFYYPDTISVDTLNVYSLPADKKDHYLEEWKNISDGNAYPIGESSYEKFHSAVLDSKIVDVAGLKGQRLLLEETEDGREDKSYVITFTFYTPKGDYVYFAIILDKATNREEALNDPRNKIFDDIIVTFRA
ncbi:MAG: hypothetical protein AAB590_01890 [Patescibacteria group bacterium]